MLPLAGFLGFGFGSGLVNPVGFGGRLGLAFSWFCGFGTFLNILSNSVKFLLGFLGWLVRVRWVWWVGLVSWFSSGFVFLMRLPNLYASLGGFLCQFSRISAGFCEGVGLVGFLLVSSS